MTNDEHLYMLQEGIEKWNTWRQRNDAIRPNLSGTDLIDANLSGANLSGANLSGTNLRVAKLIGANLSGANLVGADLSGAKLIGANLRGTDLRKALFIGTNLSHADLREANLREAELFKIILIGANLSGANLDRIDLKDADLRDADLRRAILIEAVLVGANLSHAKLIRANLSGANLSHANLSDAKFSHANLSQAILIGTNLCDATLTDCTIYGISVWDIHLDRATQRDLVITPTGESVITVDDLEVAQFIYLLLNNPKIRKVIDTVAKKAVLILGNFSEEGKPVLQAIKTTLRSEGFVPILFDFTKPRSQDLTETVSTLAHLSRFIIADLTDPRSVAHELATLIPSHVVPIVPLFRPSDQMRYEYTMFRDFEKRYKDWVLPIHHYTTLEGLLATFKTQIIEPAEEKAQKLITSKNTP